MMRLWPDTLVGRTVLVVLIGVALSNGIAFALFVDEREDVFFTARGRVLAERLVATARLVQERPWADRPILLHGLRGPGLRMVWSDRPTIAINREDWQTRLLRRAIESELGPADEDRLRLARRPAAAEDRGEEPPARRLGNPTPQRGFLSPGERFRRAWRGEEEANAPLGVEVDLLTGSLSLDDGTWLNFSAPIAAVRPFWSSPPFLVVLGITVMAVAVSVWAVRKASRPLTTLARAAERLGLDVDAPPLPETGPSEVRTASRAFNEMQGRLKRFVADRVQMLAAISHDLRTPLTRMRLRAEFVEDEEQRLKMLADLAEMEAMITAALAFARDAAADEQVQPMDLAALLASVCDDAADTGADARYEGPEHLRFVGRPGALKRTFANLVDNACSYGQRARIRAWTDPGDVGPSPRGTRGRTGAALVVTVEDDGPGLPEDQLERVFEPFYRVEGSRSRETGGTGLGLALVRAAVRAHGGEVSLANRAEGGLRATVSLPLISAG